MTKRPSNALLAVLFSLTSVPALAQQTGAVTSPRNTTATGVTKPPGAADKPASGGAPFSRASTEADMQKAQRAAAARDKAWDNKMRGTMGSICKGC